MDIQQILINAFTPFVKTYWWMIQLLLVLSFLKTSFMKGCWVSYLLISRRQLS